MKFIKTPLPGCYVLAVRPIEDARGFFARAWSGEDFETAGLNSKIAQMNMAYNHKAGTLRGMHF